MINMSSRIFLNDSTKKLTNVISKIQDQSRFIWLIGEKGIGKTKNLEYILKKLYLFSSYA
jgi:midasin (ATPase involved in ribosome maturation)